MHRVILAALLPLAACGMSDGGGRAVAATGSGSSRDYPAKDFTRVELRGVDDVDVRVGPSFTVTAQGDPAVLDLLEITVDGDTLRIGRKSGIDHQRGRARVHVALPRIAAASIAGAADMTVDRVSGASFDGSIAGSGSLAVASLTAKDVGLSIAGSGDIRAAGEVSRLKADIAGAGNIAAPKLVAREATINVAGSGDVHAIVRGKATVRSLGAGDIDLGPDATCEVQKLGAGEVRCGR